MALDLCSPPPFSGLPQSSQETGQSSQLQETEIFKMNLRHNSRWIDIRAGIHQLEYSDFFEGEVLRWIVTSEARSPHHAMMIGDVDELEE